MRRIAFSWLWRDGSIVHFIVPAAMLSNIGSWVLYCFVGAVLESEDCEFEDVSRVTVNGEEAIARCAASGDSKIATMGRCLFVDLLDRSYCRQMLESGSGWVCARALMFRARRGSHLEIAECGHFAEFLERG